jgi:hypothetical protein
MSADRHGPGPTDDDLVAALSSGLSRAASGGVDTAALVSGAQAGARRIRRRRVVVRSSVAVLCVAAILPVGLNLLRGNGSSSVVIADPGTSSGPASSTGAATVRTPSTSLATEQPTRLGTQVSAPTGGLLPRDRDGDVVVPDDVLITAGDLGLAPVSVVRDDGGATVTFTTVFEPLCPAASLPGDERATGGRTVLWQGPAQGREHWRFGTAVKVFAADGAGDQLTYLKRAVGTVCSPGVSREPVAGLPGDDALLASTLIGEPGQEQRNALAFGVVRLGRVTVGVDVTVPGGVGTDEEARRALAVERVRTLLALAAERVSDLAVTAGKDPLLD